MRFLDERKGVEDKLSQMPGLKTVLESIEGTDVGVSDEEARRIVLPYSGPDKYKSAPWRMTK